jgi:predicted secreted protein
MATVKLGMRARVYRNTGTYTMPVWNEMEYVKDVKLNLSTTEVDVTTRNNNGWRAVVPTLKDVSVDLTLVLYDESDDYVVLRDAYLNGTSIDMMVLDGPVTQPGSQGPRAAFHVMSFSRNEGIGDAITIEVSLKPTLSSQPPIWHVQT